MGRGTPVATRPLFTTRPNGDAYSTTHKNTTLSIITVSNSYCINLKDFRGVEQFVIASLVSAARAAGAHDGCHGCPTTYAHNLVRRQRLFVERTI